MNASFIEQNQIIDRYLLGKLSEEQAEEFEILCLHDQNLRDQLELSERMLDGYRRAEKQNMLRPAAASAGDYDGSAQRRPLRVARNAAASSLLALPRYATAASVFLGICLLTTVSVFSQRDGSSPAFEPQINTPIYELTRTRSAAADPDYIVRFTSEPEWLVLSMDLGQVDYERYRATLLDKKHSVVWQSDGLEPNYQDALTISLNSAQLEAGNYFVRIEGLADDGSAIQVAEYGFEGRLKK